MSFTRQKRDKNYMVKYIQDLDRYLRQLEISGNIFINITNDIVKENLYGRELNMFVNSKKVFLSDINSLKYLIKQFQGRFYAIEQDS